MSARRLPVLTEPHARTEVRAASDARPDPKLRGDGVLALLEVPFLWLDRAVARFVPATLNPFAQTGAIANTTLIVAVVSGVLLLFWYSPSVHTAHASLEAMRGNPFASLVRSLHRYSSDACMLFVLLHALRIVGARRFAGARWLAWVTGLVLVGSLWLVGWLGYWLVWDEPARQIALGSSKVFDVLPIFVEPMTRSFLTDGSIQSLLFFIVFFVHMLLPLGMATALWLHITRLSRPKFLTRAPMTGAILVSLVALSLALPAVSGKPARMLEHPSSLAIDAFYVLPIALTDRLGGGAIWAIALGVTIVSLSLPWALSRGRAPVAKIDLAKCNACTLCVADCPYDAIRMVPRTDGRRYELEARIDESKCVGCGICAGSCDSSAIGLPLVSQVEARARMDAWLAGAKGEFVAFVCARSAGASLQVDAKSGVSPALPGYRVMPVPCIGWVHPLTVERAIRHDAGGVLLVGCGSTEPVFREGTQWTKERIQATRRPKLRGKGAAGGRVRVVDPSGAGEAGLRHSAEDFKRGALGRGPRRTRRGALLGAVAVTLVAVVAGVSRVGYGVPARDGAELVVSFKEAGGTGEQCRDVSDEENAQVPVHMRRARVCERGRRSVRLQVVVDGVVRIERPYAPSGLRGDGPSMAIETLRLAPGPHDVAVAIGDGEGESAFAHSDRRTIDVRPNGRVVVLFDRASAFTWEGI